MALIDKINKLFRGDKRTIKAKKNILASIIIKGTDSLIYLLLVPATLGYLNPYEYGIWLTLNSILMWINSFDIGLGNGLRNKLTAAIANSDMGLSRSYVSTAFIMLAVIMGILIIIGTCCYPFVNWYDILSTTPKHVSNLPQIVYLSFTIFCINFIFKLIGNIYLALQQPAINNFINMCGHFLSLAIIYILTLTTKGHLLWVAIAYSASPLIIYLIAYPITFKNIYPDLAPSFKYFNRKYLNDLFGVGIQFFILQLSAILLFAFSNILISHMFGPENVTPYNIAYRYYSLIPMVINLILTPMWSATTDAYIKGDILWIKKSMNAICKVLFIASGGIIIMTIISEYIYHLWIGSDVHIPFILSSIMGLYVCILIWSLAYSNFLNGIGKLRLQTINTVIVAVAFVPVSIVLGKIWNITGIVIGMCLLNLPGLILNRIQLKKLITGTAEGIWNK